MLFAAGFLPSLIAFEEHELMLISESEGAGGQARSKKTQ